MTAAGVAERLGARRVGAGWTARCPAHADRTPSLSVREGRDGRVLLRCRAGCATADVLAAAGISWSDISGAPPTPEQRQAAAQRHRAAERGWMAALLRAVSVVERRHRGHPELVALRREVARDLRAREVARG